VLSLKVILDRLKGQGISARLVGDENCAIVRVAGLLQAGQGDITFLNNPRFKSLLNDVEASAIIVKATDSDQLSTNHIIVENPHVAYAHVAGWLYTTNDAEAGIHSSAVIAASSHIHTTASIGPLCVIEADVVIGAGCQIGPGCIIGQGVEIAENSRLLANVTVCHGANIGCRVILHPGVVIGADGFGLANNDGRWVKVPQIGGVVLSDDVEVGANTTIDRGAIEDTKIGRGVKLDNQIQIGHNVHIGEHTAIAACTAVAGSTHIGQHCAIGGCVGIVGHLEITDNVTITGMSHVSQSITETGVYSSGTPLETSSQWHRNFVRMKQLDDMVRRLKKLENQLHANENQDEIK